jgi:serine/threonine-protein kinase TNNI3K
MNRSIRFVYTDTVTKVAKLREQLQKQSELKETYKARLESAQEYLRFCLDVAQQHGFLHLMSTSNHDKHSPRRDDEAEAATAAEDESEGERESVEAPPPCDPYLSATRDLAVNQGWSVAPDEVTNQDLRVDRSHAFGLNS